MVARAVDMPGVQTSESAADLGRSAPLRDAAEVVQSFYSSINRGDIDLAMSFIAEDCKYEDMIYKKPFVGHKVRRTFIVYTTSFFHPLYCNLLMAVCATADMLTGRARLLYFGSVFHGGSQCFNKVSWLAGGQATNRSCDPSYWEQSWK